MSLWLDTLGYSNPLHLVFYFIGIHLAYRALRTAVALLEAVLVYLVIPRLRQPDLRAIRGRWTVVTGATDGIGRAYAIELAKRGMSKFLLIGRNMDKLTATKDLLETRFKCQTKTFLFDFENGNYDALGDFLDTVNIGFLVHSVGVGRSAMERFGETLEDDMRILKVNGYGSAQVLGRVLPIIEKCGGGRVVILSSSQGLRPVPLIAAYSASKALMAFLAETSDREYPSVQVQCLTPALVATKIVYLDKKPSLFVVSPDQFARSAVDTLGVLRQTTGCFNHEIQMLVRHLIPWSLLRHLMMPIYWANQRRVNNLLKHNQAGAEVPAVKPSMFTRAPLRRAAA